MEPALTRIGRDELLQALASVRQGRVFDLGLELGNDSPQGSPQVFPGYRLTRYRSPRQTGGEFGLEFCTELVTGSPHISTHIDALNHHAVDGRIFGGSRVEDVLTDFGFTEHGMETVPPIIGRGVLLDPCALLGVQRLEDRFEIRTEHLVGCLQRQGTELRKGDVVLVRTGKIAEYYSDPVAFMAAQAGVERAASIWLYEQGMAVLGTDTPATEPVPHVDPPRTTHAAMLVERGVHLLENLQLDELAAAEVYEFAFICLPLRMTGSTGAWVRPVALT
jgi:kynurenine formamidase